MRKSFNHLVYSALFFVLILVPSVLFPHPDKRPRARDIGLQVGVLQPGRWNAITDVDGVRVGQVTVVQGEDIRTGVTAILPHSGNLFRQKVPAAVFVGNGFGKLAGVTQIDELGNIETPILLTNTLSVPKVADALIEYTLSGNGNETIRSVNPVVGETNDGWLNDIRGRHVRKKHVFQAIKRATSGPVEEGCVGAGTGTICMGFKGGIGTSSRVLPQQLGGYTVGVLVQTNFGGILQMNGAPVGRELGHFAFQDKLRYADGDGSCMIVVATDAPLLARNLKRLAKRAYLALSRKGAFSSNGSGDYVIAFSTIPTNRIEHDAHEVTKTVTVLRNEHLSPLFLAAVEATEEAIYNSLLKAETTSGRDGHVVEALPVNEVIKVCKKYNVLYWNEALPPAGQQEP